MFDRGLVSSLGQTAVVLAILGLAGCSGRSSRELPKQVAAVPKLTSLRVEPPQFILDGKWDSQVVVVTGQSPDGQVHGVSSLAHFRPANPGIAEVSPEGIVRPRANGVTSIAVNVGAAKADLQVTVTNAAFDSVSFVRQVLPLLTHAGCNAAQCHGARAGKGEFKLSLFGGQPDEDFLALTRAARGRRIDRVNPGQSLFLRKAARQLGHGGGQLIPPGSPEYNLLVAWVTQGARGPDESEPVLTSLRVTGAGLCGGSDSSASRPGDTPRASASAAAGVSAPPLVPTNALTLNQGQSCRLLVRGVYSDGSSRDLTSLVAFNSADTNVVTVHRGQIHARAFGEAAILVTCARRAAVLRALVPQPLPMPFPQVPSQNRIDTLVAAKLKLLGLPPSELCADQEFLRRVYLDVIGVLPTAAEARVFLADTDPQKRSRLIDQLLARDEFADSWSLKWGDLLRIKSEYPVRVWPKGVAAYYRWLHESIRENKPYDQFARELLTATGSNFRDGAANFVRAVPSKDPQTVGETAALIFMGARFGCARCHVHPSETWSPADNLSLAACFAKVAYKSTSEWKEEIVFNNPKGLLRNPRTKEIVKPRLPDGQPLVCPPDADPRVKFADWLVAPDNPWFARNLANRVWYWLLGRGLVHEPDDLRPTNPPENPELLDYLAAELVAHKFDLKHLYRLILNSRTYQLSSVPNQWNQRDTTHFSHHQVKRLAAEELVDAICQVTEVPETYISQIPEPYTRLPADFRAVQVADGNIGSSVLELFGRPPRDTPYEGERCSAPSMRQALYFINSDHLEGKVTTSPRLKRLLTSTKTDPEIIGELYYTALSRPPTTAETSSAGDYLAQHKSSRAQALQDLTWALLNTKEFMFVR